MSVGAGTAEGVAVKVGSEEVWATAAGVSAREGWPPEDGGCEHPVSSMAHSIAPVASADIAVDFDISPPLYKMNRSNHADSSMHSNDAVRFVRI